MLSRSLSACPDACLRCGINVWPSSPRTHQKNCQRYCSKDGWCGDSDSHKNGGTDCTACSGKFWNLGYINSSLNKLKYNHLCIIIILILLSKVALNMVQCTPHWIFLTMEERLRQPLLPARPAALGLRDAATFLIGDTTEDAIFQVLLLQRQDQVIPHLARKSAQVNYFLILRYILLAIKNLRSHACIIFHIL